MTGDSAESAKRTLRNCLGPAMWIAVGMLLMLLLVAAVPGAFGFEYACEGICL